MIKAANCRDVRLQKYKTVLNLHNNKVDFVGWNRLGGQEDIEFINGFDNIYYVLKGYSQSKISILIGSILWLIVCFIFLVKNAKKYDIVYCADFEAALPLAVLNIFFHKKYIYDIYDEVELRYNYGSYVKKILTICDEEVKKRSFQIIVVDAMRLNEKYKYQSKTIIVENSPLDFYKGNFQKKEEYKKQMVVSGYLSDTRGMDSIYQLALCQVDYDFIVVGRFTSQKMKNRFLSLNNVKYYDFMPQNKLFELIKDSFLIFSLYDPSVEINLKAASNKLYDSMMLGIPVVVNQEIYAAQFVEINELGICVPYIYEESSWKNAITKLENDYLLYSSSCRKMFESNYNFQGKVENVFSLK